MKSRKQIRRQQRIIISTSTSFAKIPEQFYPNQELKHELYGSNANKKQRKAIVKSVISKRLVKRNSLKNKR